MALADIDNLIVIIEFSFTFDSIIIIATGFETWFKYIIASIASRCELCQFRDVCLAKYRNSEKFIC